MNRRKFFKTGLAGMAAVGLGQTATPAYALGAKNKEPIPGALGMLYDSTLCVGCQACVVECQNVNNTMVNPKGEQTYSDNDKLSPYTRNVIQVWSSGTGTNKDRIQDGYAYVKKQCMHCVDPNCVSVCPVQALTKDPKTGIVGYDPDICTGCRYCMVACPFDVPKYDYDNPVGQISKCELCNQKGLKRIDQGKLPGCCDVCPTGAIIFGSREDLLEEAHRRLGALRGSDYDYPRQHVNSQDRYRATVPRYLQYIYGEKEAGGTQVLMIAGVPYENLGMPHLDELSTGARAEHLQHFLYRGMILPLAALAGLSVITYRNMHEKELAESRRARMIAKKQIEDEEKHDHE